jgi:hypothetical protein
VIGWPMKIPKGLQPFIDDGLVRVKGENFGR